MVRVLPHICKIKKRLHDNNLFLLCYTLPNWSLSSLAFMLLRHTFFVELHTKALFEIDFSETLYNDIIALS